MEPPFFSNSLCMMSAHNCDTCDFEMSNMPAISTALKCKRSNRQTGYSLAFSFDLFVTMKSSKPGRYSDTSRRTSSLSASVRLRPLTAMLLIRL